MEIDSFGRFGSKRMLRSLSLKLAPIAAVRKTGTVARIARTFSNVSQPTLDVEYPGIPPLTPASAHPKPETKVTTLSNGLRVASEVTQRLLEVVAHIICK